MASIWKEKGNPIWRAKIRRPNGKYTNRSTKQTDRRKAQKEADFLQDQSDAISRGTTNEIRLVKAINKMVAEGGLGQIQVVSIVDALTQFLETTRKRRRADSTIQKYKGILEDFIKFLGDEKAAKSIYALQRSDIEQFINSELAAGKSGTSVDQRLKIIRMALSHTKRRGLVPDNVAQEIEPIGESSENRERFSDEEIKKIYHTADSEWKGMILLGFWYGMRIGDAANLKWECIDLAEKTIRLTPRLSGFNYHSHSWLGLWVSIKLSGVSVSSSCRGVFSKG